MPGCSSSTSRPPRSPTSSAPSCSRRSGEPRRSASACSTCRIASTRCSRSPTPTRPAQRRGRRLRGDRRHDAGRRDHGDDRAQPRRRVPARAAQPTATPMLSVRDLGGRRSASQPRRRAAARSSASPVWPGPGAASCCASSAAPATRDGGTIDAARRASCWCGIRGRPSASASSTCPQDRRDDGLIPDTAERNLNATTIGRHTAIGPFVSTAAERRHAAALWTRFGVRGAGRWQPVLQAVGRQPAEDDARQVPRPRPERRAARRSDARRRRRHQGRDLPHRSPTSPPAVPPCLRQLRAARAHRPVPSHRRAARGPHASPSSTTASSTSGASSAPASGRRSADVDH